ncbi:MAG: hypothetical protein ACLTW9_06580 [Enterocloster sp.]
MVYTAYMNVVFAVNTITDMMVLNHPKQSVIPAGHKAGAFWAGELPSSAVCWVLRGEPWSRGLPAAVGDIGNACGGEQPLMAVAAYHLKSPREVIKSVAGIYLVSVVFLEV